MGSYPSFFSSSTSRFLRLNPTWSAPTKIFSATNPSLPHCSAKAASVSSRAQRGICFHMHARGAKEKQIPRACGARDDMLRLFARERRKESNKVLSHLRDRGNAPFSQPVSGTVRRYALFGRDVEHHQNRVVDLARLVARPLHRPPLELGVDVHQPAGVDHVVGRVRDPL